MAPEIPKDAVLVVTFDVRAITPEGSEHLFTHALTPDGARTWPVLVERMADLAIDAADALAEMAGIEPSG